MSGFGRIAGRGRLIGAAMAASVAAAVAVTSRCRRQSLTLPDPAPLAAEAATSVHNAAKSTVIAAARESEEPDHTLIGEVVHQTVTDATASGADVLAAAIGAVEGAFAIAHLVDNNPHELARTASFAAMEAAALQGATAADRVRDILGDHLDRR